MKTIWLFHLMIEMVLRAAINRFNHLIQLKDSCSWASFIHLGQDQVQDKFLILFLLNFCFFLFCLWKTNLKIRLHNFFFFYLFNHVTYCRLMSDNIFLMPRFSQSIWGLFSALGLTWEGSWDRNFNALDTVGGILSKNAFFKHVRVHIIVV